MEILSNLRPICIHSYLLGRKEQKINIVDREETEINMKETKNQRNYLTQLASKQRQIYDLNTKLNAAQFELSFVNKKLYDLEYNNRNYSEKIYEWEVKYQKLKTQLNLTIKTIFDLDYYSIDSDIKPCEWKIKYEEINNKVKQWEQKELNMNNQLILANARVQELQLLFKQSSEQVTQWQQKYQKIQIQHNTIIQNMNQQITISVNQKVSQQKLITQDQWQKKYSEIHNHLQLIIQDLTNKLSDWQRKYSNQQITILINQKVSEKNLIIQELTNKLSGWQRKYTEIYNHLISADSRVQELQLLFKQSSEQLTQWQQKYQKIQIQHNTMIQNMNQQITILIDEKVSEKNLIIQDLTNKLSDWQRKYADISNQIILINQQFSYQKLTVRKLTTQIQASQDFTIKLNNRISELVLQNKNLNDQLDSKQQSLNNILIHLNNQNTAITKRQKQNQLLSDKYAKLLEEYNKLIQSHRKSQESITTTQTTTQKFRSQATIESGTSLEISSK